MLMVILLHSNYCLFIKTHRFLNPIYLEYIRSATYMYLDGVLDERIKAYSLIKADESLTLSNYLIMPLS